MRACISANVQTIVTPDQIPAELQRAAFPLVTTPDLSAITALLVGHGLKFEFPGLSDADLTRAANNIRNRARRIGGQCDMEFGVHRFGESAVYLVRKR